jgi:hypothetical protein
VLATPLHKSPIYVRDTMKESDLTEQINGKNSWDKSSTKQQSSRLKRRNKQQKQERDSKITEKSISKQVRNMTYYSTGQKMRPATPARNKNILELFLQRNCNNWTNSASSSNPHGSTISQE